MSISFILVFMKTRIYLNINGHIKKNKIKKIIVSINTRAQITQKGFFLFLFTFFDYHVTYVSTQ